MIGARCAINVAASAQGLHTPHCAPTHVKVQPLCPQRVTLSQPACQHGGGLLRQCSMLPLSGSTVPPTPLLTGARYQPTKRCPSCTVDSKFTAPATRATQLHSTDQTPPQTRQDQHTRQRRGRQPAGQCRVACQGAPTHALQQAHALCSCNMPYKYYNADTRSMNSTTFICDSRTIIWTCSVSNKQASPHRSQQHRLPISRLNATMQPGKHIM